jgi:hypothetical protein
MRLSKRRIHSSGTEPDAWKSPAFSGRLPAASHVRAKLLPQRAIGKAAPPKRGRGGQWRRKQSCPNQADSAGQHVPKGFVTFAALRRAASKGAVATVQPDYAGYRFPSDVIQRAVWMYLRFTLSYREVEDLLAERGIEVSYETIRRWVRGAVFARRLRAQRAAPHRRRHLDVHPDPRQADVPLARGRCRGRSGRRAGSGHAGRGCCPQADA